MADHDDDKPLPPELDPRGPARAVPAAGRSRPGAPGGPAGRRPRSGKRIAAWIAGGLAALLVLGAITGWVAIDSLLGNIKKIDPFCHTNCHRPSPGVAGDLNILVVGSDSRAGLTRAQQNALHVGSDAGRRSDTMILLHIPRGGGKAVLISLPRDSYVTIPAHRDASGQIVPARMNKLNAAYSLGGPALAIATVEANTHVRIDHYVEVNFVGFVKIVNALGGVTVCTPTTINDPVHWDAATHGYVGSGLYLPAGKSHINGAKALAYVRAREFDPSADLGRIKRQQKFMASLMQEATSAGTLLNPIKLYDFLSAVTGSITTDKSFGVSQIRRLAGKLKSMSPAHVQLLTVPLKPGSFNTAVGNVVEWDPVVATQLFRDITLDRPIDAADAGTASKVTVPPTSVSLEVLNATSTAGLAHNVANQLATMGFGIRGTGNAPAGSSPSTTVVRYGPGRTDSAKTVAAAVPGSVLKLDPTFGNGLQLLVGSNFHGVQKVTVTASPAASAPHVDIRSAAQDICA